MEDKGYFDSFGELFGRTSTGNLGEKFEEDQIVEYVHSNIDGDDSEGAS